MSKITTSRVRSNSSASSGESGGKLKGSPTKVKEE